MKIKDNFALECRKCGSHDVLVGVPDTTDMAHPKITYACRNCGEINTVECKILGISETGALQVSIEQEPKILLA